MTQLKPHLSLADLIPGDCAMVDQLVSSGYLRRRLLDLGLITGTKVTCLGTSPGGDPAAFLIRGAVIALRSEDSKTVLVHLCKQEASTYESSPSHSHIQR